MGLLQLLLQFSDFFSANSELLVYLQVSLFDICPFFVRFFCGDPAIVNDLSQTFILNQQLLSLTRLYFNLELQIHGFFQSFFDFCPVVFAADLY